jgi:hypothetical protein
MHGIEHIGGKRAFGLDARRCGLKQRDKRAGARNEMQPIIGGCGGKLVLGNPIHAGSCAFAAHIVA